MKVHRCRTTRNESVVLNELAQITRETGHEVGTEMCFNKNTGSWAAGHLCVGDECFLEMKYRECPRGYNVAYHVHTHPDDYYIAPSVEDFEEAVQHHAKKECVIVPNIKKMACYDVANIYKEGFNIKDLRALYYMLEAKAMHNTRDIQGSEEEKTEKIDIEMRKLVEKMLPWLIGEHNVCYYDLR